MERTAERLAERARALRDEGLSFGEIARQLKVSKSTVYRWTNGVDAGDGPGRQDDDEVARARRELELDRIAAARRRLMAAGEPAGDAGIGRMVDRLERRLDDLASQLRAQPAAAPAPPNLFDQMKMARDAAEQLKVFFPASSSTSAEDLQYRVAMERLNAEQRLKLRELDLRFEEVRAVVARNEWQAKFVEGQLPAIMAWVMARGWKEETATAAGADGRPALEVVNLPEVQGPCPACGKLIGIPGGRTEDVCPSCSAQLRVVDGVIELGAPGARADRGGFAS